MGAAGGASRGELVVAIALRRIDMGRDGARGGTDHRAGIAVRPHGRQERRIHAAVAAGRNRDGRGAAVDQLHGLDVVAAPPADEQPPWIIRNAPVRLLARSYAFGKPVLIARYWLESGFIKPGVMV